MNNKWEIRDETGTLYAGKQKEIQLIWDFMTRDIDDLANEYRHTYTIQELENLKNEYDLTWEGDIELLEVHAIYTNKS